MKAKNASSRLNQFFIKIEHDLSLNFQKLKEKKFFSPYKRNLFYIQHEQLATKIGLLEMTKFAIEKTVKDTLPSNGAPRKAAMDQNGNTAIGGDL